MTVTCDESCCEVELTKGVAEGAGHHAQAGQHAPQHYRHSAAKASHQHAAQGSCGEETGRGRDKGPASRWQLTEVCREGESEAGRRGFHQARWLKGQDPWSPQAWILIPTLPQTGYGSQQGPSLSVSQFLPLHNGGSDWVRCKGRACIVQFDTERIPRRTD